MPETLNLDAIAAVGTAEIARRLSASSEGRADFVKAAAGEGMA